MLSQGFSEDLQKVMGIMLGVSNEYIFESSNGYEMFSRDIDDPLTYSMFE